MADLRDLAREYLAALDADIAALDDPEAHEDIARLLERSLAALPALRAAVAAPADTGWRPRPPTAAEVIAHHEAHGGVWCGAPSPHRATPPRGRR